MNKETKEIRRLVADLIWAAGCSCCRSDEKWEDAQESLAVLLKVPEYSDDSGRDFSKFRTKSL